MKKYIVKSLAVSGLGNKVFRCRAEVNENNFPPGRAEELVKSGHLVRTEETAPAAEPEKVKPKVTGDDFSTLTKKQIGEKLTERGIEFDPKSNKEHLLALLTAPAAEPEKDTDADKDEEDESGSDEALKNVLNQD